MMMKKVVLGLMAVGALAFTLSVAHADSDFEYGKQMPKLVKWMPNAKVTLDQGIKTAAAGGKAISAQYEVDEDNGFQLSVFVSKGSTGADVHEVIVNYETGKIKSDEKLTDPDDIKDAGKQLAAVEKAKGTLDQAVAEAVKANPGFVAIRIVPKGDGAQVTLLKDGKTKKVDEKLD
ncbi:MAG TPA: hypothetical protein VGR79_09420 [Stellaceae bacterium]|nr:hypothetical protein [Stellaceae bacterium]